jgi:hypothetical protein
MEIMKEIRFKAFTQSKGNNQTRKRYNYFKTIKTIKELVYRDHIIGCVTMKHNQKLYFGHSINGGLIKRYVNNEFE